MPAFTPEQEARIAEIVRAAIAEQPWQIAAKVIGEIERRTGKSFDQSANGIAAYFTIQPFDPPTPPTAE